ncbi:Fic family protein [Undibacterium seohonense]|uniref:Fic family protein n=1 Tax=Undibacterium seohonense TaxID=1344950 RepID=A0ABR6XA50_9BURK|nr:Fic family protein [Undibacterium seohonense]MBC3809715.1 Fic family protein [Undibacterium seohonense]
MDKVGGKWLIEKYNLYLVQPLRVESYIAKSRKTDITFDFKEQHFTESFRPEDTIPGHLVFMLKHEEVHLEMMARLFNVIEPAVLEEWINDESTGSYARRVGFFYEWMTGRKLSNEDVTQGNYVEALEPKKYFVAQQVNQIRRWRVRDNMPGNAEFCPIVYLSDNVRKAQSYDCNKALVGLEERFGTDVLMRSSVWLTIKESRASFAIEHEEDQEDRIKRFAMVMENRCGELQNPLSIPELESLQKEILGESALSYGVRRSPVFVGHSSGYRDVVDYIAPHWHDVPDQLIGLAESLNRTRGSATILRAAVASFGFVYIHPMADGNGRISRFLVNDILRRDGAVPKPFILPISATITHSSTARVGYDSSLEMFSKPLMKRYVHEYRFGSTETYEDGVESNFHFRSYKEAMFAWKYPNLTSHVEYLGNVIQQTIEEEMHNEALYIRNVYRARSALKQIVEAPDVTLDIIISSVWQNKRLTNVIRKKHPKLNDEVKAEKIVNAVLFAFKSDHSEGMPDVGQDVQSEDDSSDLIFR